MIQLGKQFLSHVRDGHKNLMNSFISILASFRTPLNVPIFNSLCMGTTVPTFPSGVIFESLT